jgi:hypothetical protein
LILEDEDIWYTIPEGMRENKVYLLQNDDYEPDQMEDNIAGYIGIMKEESGGS